MIANRIPQTCKFLNFPGILTRKRIKKFYQMKNIETYGFKKQWYEHLPIPFHKFRSLNFWLRGDKCLEELYAKKAAIMAKRISI